MYFVFDTECEGLITVTVKKNNKILTLINAYKEALRANFKIDDGEFIKGALGEFETASSEGTDDRPGPKDIYVPHVRREHPRRLTTRPKRMLLRRRGNG